MAVVPSGRKTASGAIIWKAAPRSGTTTQQDTSSKVSTGTGGGNLPIRTYAGRRITEEQYQQVKQEKEKAVEKTIAVTGARKEGGTVTVSKSGLVTERDPAGKLVKQFYTDTKAAEKVIGTYGASAERGVKQYYREKKRYETLAPAFHQEASEIFRTTPYTQEVTIEQGGTSMTFQRGKEIPVPNEYSSWITGAKKKEYERPSITSFEEYMKGQERKEAPIRAGIFQPLEKGLGFLEKKAKGAKSFRPYAEFGVGFITAPVSFSKSLAHPVKTAKGIGAAVKDPFAVGQAIGAELERSPKIFGEFIGYAAISYGIGKLSQAIKVRGITKQVGATETARIPRGKGFMDVGKTSQAFKVGKQTYRIGGKTLTYQAQKGKYFNVYSVGEYKIKVATPIMKPKVLAKTYNFKYATRGITKGKWGYYPKYELSYAGKPVETGKLLTITKPIGDMKFRTIGIEAPLQPRLRLRGGIYISTKTLKTPKYEIWWTKGLKSTLPKLGKKGQLMLRKPEIIFKIPEPAVSSLSTMGASAATAHFLKSIIEPSSLLMGTTGLLSAGAFVSGRLQPSFTKTILKSESKTKLKSEYKTFSILMNDLGLKAGVINITGQIPAQQQMRGGQLISTVIGTPPAVPVVPIIPPPTPIPIIKPLFKFDHQQLFKKQKVKGLKRATKYQRSLFTRRGKKPKLLTGWEIRPIIAM